jgi:hypothetical protein
MITLTKLKLYKSYRGDVDLFGRASSPDDRKILNDADFYLIESLLQHATVIDRKLGSETRADEAKKRLHESCEDGEVIKEIHKLAKKDPTSWWLRI